MPHPLETNTGFYDKSFQEDQTSSYSLFVQLGTGGIVFVLYDQKKNKYIGFESLIFKDCNDLNNIPVHLDALIEKKPWIEHSFRKVEILITESANTLVPLPLFDKKKVADYLEFNFDKQDYSKAVFDVLKNVSVSNCYYLPISVNEKIKSIWPNARVLHFSSALIETLALNFKNLGDDNRVFLNVHKYSFDLVYIKQNKLQFANNFKYKTKEDFIYFLIAALEQLELNPEEARVVLMGMIDKNDTLYEMIYRYIRHSEFIQRNDTFLYSHMLEELKYHYFYTLFNVLQCE